MPIEDPNQPNVVVEKEIDLPSEVRETSGILFHKGELWTHNDSGNDAVLYRLDLVKGDVVERLELPIKALDWEDMTSDETSLYVADFGNNHGNRQDLRIFKFPIEILGATDQVVGMPDTISFYYPEQTTFPGSYNHNFDCESILTVGASILILTKNWANKQTVVYEIPKSKGHHAAKALQTIDTKGLITSAVSTDEKVYLLGYNFTGSNTPFLLSFDRQIDQIDWDQSKRWNVALDRQTEAIGVDQQGHLWITAEKGRAKKATLFRLRP